MSRHKRNKKHRNKTQAQAIDTSLHSSSSVHSLFFKPFSAIKDLTHNTLSAIAPSSSSFSSFVFLNLLKLANSESVTNPFDFSHNNTYYSIKSNFVRGNEQMRALAETVYRNITSQLQAGVCGEVLPSWLVPKQMSEIWNQEFCFSSFKFMVDAMDKGSSDFKDCVVKSILEILSKADDTCDTLDREMTKESLIIIGSVFGAVGLFIIFASIAACCCRRRFDNNYIEIPEANNGTQFVTDPEIDDFSSYQATAISIPDRFRT